MMYRQTMQPLSIIVAIEQSGGFGFNGQIPWINEPFAKADLKNFQTITTGKACIMGRKTYDDMLAIVKERRGDKPITELLPNRKCYVVTRNENLVVEGATRVRNIFEAVQDQGDGNTDEVFVIGGEKLFIEALAWVDKIYMTVVKHDYECDRFFPIKYINTNFQLVSGKDHDDITFTKYHRKPGR